MATSSGVIHALVHRRQARGWSQSELARRASIPRTTVGAVEGERLTPSVATALALARTLECSVEELFGGGSLATPLSSPQWAWTPRTSPCRYWEAEVAGRRLLYPAESVLLNVHAHDGIWRSQPDRDVGPGLASTTLVLACCDPAAGLLAAEYARGTGLRLLVFPRSGGEALNLLQRGLVHVAGLHRSTEGQPNRNAETVRAQLGNGYRLVRVADWQEGLALDAGRRAHSPQNVAKGIRRWALRETGSAARECLDELRADAFGRTVYSHTSVAEAVRGGWADAGICIQLCAEEAGLNFLPVRKETLDFCFSERMQHDPRLQALVRLLRSRSYRQLISDLPGYESRQTGEVFSV